MSASPSRADVVSASVITRQLRKLTRFNRSPTPGRRIADAIAASPGEDIPEKT